MIYTGTAPPTSFHAKASRKTGSSKYYTFRGMIQDVVAQIKKLSPLMDENSEIFHELTIFFGGAAKIEVHAGDLPKFLGRKRLYRIIRLKGESYKDCVYQLVDDHPESMEALGMLRYYVAPTGQIKWEDIEKAETAMGNELTVNAYGWMPDAWTVFEKNASQEDADTHEMVALLAFDFGE